ncbi:MAG: hypothetical protein GY847_28445 [Proteobacteria bacterium]|nr:hypothetical protein [Pseudomonadota bacterium]
MKKHSLKQSNRRREGSGMRCMASVLAATVVFALPLSNIADGIAKCLYGNCNDGFGIHLQQSGNVYIGTFKDGQYDGEGIVLTVDGTVVEQGNFVNGKLAPREEKINKIEEIAEIESNADAVWKRDSRKILTMVEPLRIYRRDEDDTSAQTNEKKRLLKKALARLNRKLKNKLMSLERLILNNVSKNKKKYVARYNVPSPDCVLYHYGESPCLNAGIYIDEYDPYSCDVKRMDVEIVRTIESKKEALELTTGDMGPVSCKISHLEYSGWWISERLTIRCR